MLLTIETLQGVVNESNTEASAAYRVIQEHETIHLSRAEQIAFVRALLDPPPPNARLRKAAKAYRKQVGL